MLTNYSLILLLFLSCASREKAIDPNNPQTINLNNKNKASRTHKYIYDEVVMNGPNFNVYQSHGGLKKHFSLLHDWSNLCGPSALATSLIHEKNTNPKSKDLSLEGLSPDGGSYDANQVIHQLVDCSRSSSEYGTKLTDMAKCLTQIYSNSKLEVDIKIIHPDKFGEVLPGIEHEKRRITINDIIYFIKNKYQVIGTIDSLEPDNSHKFWLVSKHAVALTGYVRNKDWPSTLLYVFVNNPNDNNKQIEYPLYEQALITKIPDSSKFPATSGDLAFEGYGNYGLSKRAVLTGLLVYKTKVSKAE